MATKRRNAVTKLIVINGILSYSDGTQVPDEVWAQWQQERVAFRNLRDDTENVSLRRDTRIGRGIQWVGEQRPRRANSGYSPELSKALAAEAVERYNAGTLFQR